MLVLTMKIVKCPVFGELCLNIGTRTGPVGRIPVFGPLLCKADRPYPWRARYRAKGEGRSKKATVEEASLRKNNFRPGEEENR